MHNFQWQHLVLNVIMSAYSYVRYIDLLIWFITCYDVWLHIIDILLIYSPKTFCFLFPVHMYVYVHIIPMHTQTDTMPTQCP